MWLGGVKRTAAPDARIGFHVAWTDNHEACPLCVGIAKAYETDMGLSPAAVTWTLPPTGIHILTPADAQRLGIEAEWR